VLIGDDNVAPPRFPFFDSDNALTVIAAEMKIVSIAQTRNMLDRFITAFILYYRYDGATRSIYH
jgi:hypothetical protein